MPTPTGAKADHRLPLKPSQIETLARALAADPSLAQAVEARDPFGNVDTAFTGDVTLAPSEQQKLAGLIDLMRKDETIELTGRQVAMNRRAFAWGRLLAHDPDAVEKIARPLLRSGGGAPRSAPASRASPSWSRRSPRTTSSAVWHSR